MKWSAIGRPRAKAHWRLPLPERGEAVRGGRVRAGHADGRTGEARKDNADDANSNDAFGGRHVVPESGIGPGGVVQGPRERFEGGFGTVVVVFTGQQTHVQTETS